MDIPFWQLILLSVLQGITEFLPISSSGHLVIVEAWLGLDPEKQRLLLLNVLLHAGTLLAILTYYWRDIREIVARRRWPIVGLLVVGTIPVVIVGLGLKASGWDRFLNYPAVAGAGLILTAALLLFWHRQDADERTVETLGWRRSLAIGLLQCLAILPGVSRSGTTISSGTRCGLNSSAAARWAFLLGIPAIGGATLVEGLDAVRDLAGGDQYLVAALPGLVLGFCLAWGVGYVALSILIKMLRHGTFKYFAWYCLGLAVLVFITIS